jgi:cation diffusion facilitator CzcD-associated flavoprotein CzcO
LEALAARIKLKEAGFDDIVILEKAGKVGGTGATIPIPVVAATCPLRSISSPSRQA